jgi:transposase
MGRPSVAPELMIRMLIIGYCFGIRSERRLCEGGHLNLAYRWFCRLGLDGDVPDHSTFSKNRHGRFRESDLLPRVFETVLHIFTRRLRQQPAEFLSTSEKRVLQHNPGGKADMARTAAMSL